MIPFTRYEILITILFIVFNLWEIWSSWRRAEALISRFQAQGRMERAAHKAALEKMQAAYDEQLAVMQAQYDRSLSAMRMSFDRSIGVIAKAGAKGKPS